MYLTLFVKNFFSLQYSVLGVKTNVAWSGSPLTFSNENPLYAFVYPPHLIRLFDATIHAGGTHAALHRITLVQVIRAFAPIITTPTEHKTVVSSFCIQ